MGHKQPATPIQTDNAMAEAVINAKITPKQSKAMDMCFHWLKDRECQQNSNSTGDQANSIMLTIGPNTIQ